MTDASGEVAETDNRVGAVLLEAKLSVPYLRVGSVSRDQLIRAARAGGCRVVGVTAPAGYGKSTLLAQWAESDDRPVAWVSLDRFDDDPSVLLPLLASAYARVSGDTDLIAEVSGLGVSALGRGAPRLAWAFRTSQVPFVLMVDDLHELRSSACHDVLEVVIAGIPPSSQLVAASRSEQPHLPRLRASGDAVELGPGELALDASGAEHIFREARVRVTPALAEAVTVRTEGWPIGLHLAALIARDSGGDALTISGDDRYVADYLYRAAWLSVPADLQRFLRRTAVLDQLCAGLCDRVLDEDGAGSRLRELEARSLFVVALDRRRDWYRYHALFREFLLGELRRVDPEMIVKLHLRAADWYESQGSPALALEHLLHTGERERYVPLVTMLALPTYQSGHMATVQRWLETVGAPALEAYPPLAVLAGWVAVLSGHPADAQRWAAFAETAAFEQATVDGTSSFASARAMLLAAVCTHGPAQMAADADFGAVQEPHWSPWRATALVLCAEARLLLGERDSAATLFRETAEAGAAMGNVDTLILTEAELAVLAMDDGRWAEATEHARVAVESVDRYQLDDYATSVLAFAAAARLAVHGGDRRDADRQLARGMRARGTCTSALPYIAVRVRQQMAQVFAANADYATARHLLREVDEILHHRPDLGVLVTQVTELRGVLQKAKQGTAGGVIPFTAAELRLLPYLQTHLTFREIGERLFVSRNTIGTEVASIYRKLGVASRSTAVEQATAVGLLGR